MCDLCTPADVLMANDHAYARYDSNSLSRGHVIVVPKRHVADYFDMTEDEHAAIAALLRAVHAEIAVRFSPDGFNIGVNVGRVAGQNRMHVHLHLIPRYAGDVPDPSGGIRCVLARH